MAQEIKDYEEEVRRAGFGRAEDIANLLGLSVRRVQQYRAEGALVTEKTKVGVRYNLIKSFIALAKHLLTRQDSKNAKQRIDIATADLRERQAARELIRLKRLRGEVHDARHVKAIMTRNIIDARAAFLALPDRVAPELASCAGANEIAAALRKEVYSILESLANKKYSPEEFRAMVEADGDEIDIDGEEDQDDAE